PGRRQGGRGRPAREAAAVVPSRGRRRMREFTPLRYEVENGLARLTPDRPESMNGMTNRMVREARDALELAASDASVRVLVLTGEGRAFCPGADLKHFTQGERDERLTSREFKVTTLLHEIPAVTV